MQKLMRTLIVSHNHPHPSLRRGPSEGSSFHNYLNSSQENVASIHLHTESMQVAPSLYSIWPQVLTNTQITHPTKSSSIPTLAMRFLL